MKMQATEVIDFQKALRPISFARAIKGDALQWLLFRNQFFVLSLCLPWFYIDWTTETKFESEI